MTKTEQLASAARKLNDEQLDGLIAFVNYLASEAYIDTAPASVLALIDRGIADAEAGRIVPGEGVYERLSRKISASRS